MQQPVGARHQFALSSQRIRHRHDGDCVTRRMLRSSYAEGAAVADDYDSPWKEAIENYFADFMHFYFPAAHARIDWSQPYVFLDQELRAVVHDAELGTRLVDKLVRVSSVDGMAEWLYVHIEIQGNSQQEFAERMFVYHYRLYDRYRKPIASLAVLADDQPGWRPESFSYETCGCHVQLRFPVAKLMDWAGSEDRLEDSGNPFAMVTLAHLATRSTCKDMRARYAAKSRLLQAMYRRGLHKQQVLDLFKVIDWLMRLPKDLDVQLRQDLNTIEKESGMVYISSIERLAIEEGMAKGMRQGEQKGLEQGLQKGMQQGRLEGKAQLLARLLSQRFGELPGWAGKQIQQASEAELDMWSEALLSSESIDALLGADRH